MLSSLPRRTAKALARTASSAVVGSVGVDRTDEITGRPSLIVAPHPDDETLGCGATIARMRSRGTQVFVVLVTGGGQSPRPPGMSFEELVSLRRSEAISALAHLGMDDEHVSTLDFEDGGLSDEEALKQAISAVITATGVEQVMVTSVRDRHPDHAAVARATSGAVASGCPNVRVYEYAVWQRLPAFSVARDLAEDVRQGSTSTRRRRSRPHLVSTQGFLEAKRQALVAYQSQLAHFPLGFVQDFFLPFEAFTEVRRAPSARSATG